VAVRGLTAWWAGCRVRDLYFEHLDGHTSQRLTVDVEGESRPKTDALREEDDGEGRMDAACANQACIIRP
jgi:hypothetical protein